MSVTPRTDEAVWHDVDYDGKEFSGVDPDFARELERELAKAKEQILKLENELKAFKVTYQFEHNNKKG
jgi:hypothetical protein